MIQNLRNRMEAWIKKIQEMSNKDLEELKNKQTVMKNTIEMKNTPINGKISCSHGMEQLILLKHPCYPKQWTQ